MYNPQPYMEQTARKHVFTFSIAIINGRSTWFALSTSPDVLKFLMLVSEEGLRISTASPTKPVSHSCHFVVNY